MAASGADGILVARGALGSPWIMAQIEEILRDGKVMTVIDEETRLNTIMEHLELMIERYGERGVILMRKHFNWYFKGLKNGKEIRMELMKATTFDEVKKILDHARTLDLQPV